MKHYDKKRISDLYALAVSSGNRLGLTNRRVKGTIDVQGKINFVNNGCLKKQQVHAWFEALLSIPVNLYLLEFPTEREIIIARSLFDTFSEATFQLAMFILLNEEDDEHFPAEQKKPLESRSGL